MRTLYYTFETGQELLKWSLGHFRSGGMFVPSNRFVREKERVMLEIRIKSLMDVYCFQAGVAKKGASFADGGRRLSGMELEFLTVDQVLIDQMMGDIETTLGSFAEREDDRADVNMSAVVEFDGLLSDVPVLDFGPGGVFVADVSGVLEDDTVKVRLVSQDHDLDQTAVAQVAWAGEKEGAFGLGLRFVFGSRGDARSWQSTFRRVRRKAQRAERALVAV